MSDQVRIDPELDLVLERVVDVRPELLWRAWTEPELLVRWFTPAPWTTVACEIDLRPGGHFRTTMRSPEGETLPPSSGCFLEVVAPRRLVWTDALMPGFRPSAEPFMTAAISMEAEGVGTRYMAVAMHAKPEDRQRHEEMGFHTGWGAALDQLVALTKAL